MARKLVRRIADRRRRAWLVSDGVGRYRPGERHVAVIPRDHPRDGTRCVVLYCHSVNNDAGQAIVRGWIDPVVHALAGAGFPVLSCDLAGPRTWGNVEAQDALSDAYGFAVESLGVRADKALLLATSMGTLVALNWARAQPSRVAAIAAAVPVVSLSDMHDHDRGGHARSIEAAYGGPEGYARTASAHDPMRHAPAYRGLPLALWRASDDPTCPPEVVDAFADRAGASVFDLGAVGHNPHPAPPGEVVAFMRKHVDPCVTSSV